MPHVANSNEELQCLQVWGGNRPLNTAVRMPGLNAYVYSKPHEVAESGTDGGGDVYYMSSCATGRIARFLLADVSGHGVSVSSVAAELRDLMQRHMNYLNQSKFMQTLNREFADLAKSGLFATSVVVSCWLPDKEMVVCNAGHPRALWYQAREGRWLFLDPELSRPDAAAELGPNADLPRNLPLGILDPASYDQIRVRFEPGDLLMLYTDSVTEARSPSGRLLGEKGLLELTERLDGTQPETIVPTLLSALRAHRGGSEPDDDLSIILLHHNAERHTASLAGALSHLGRFFIRAGEQLRGDRVGEIYTHTLSRIGASVKAR